MFTKYPPKKFFYLHCNAFQAKTESQSGPIGGRLRGHFAASHARHSKCFQCLLGRKFCMRKLTDRDVAFRVTEVQLLTCQSRLCGGMTTAGGISRFSVLGLVIDCKKTDVRSLSGLSVGDHL